MAANMATDMAQPAPYMPTAAPVLAAPVSLGSAYMPSVLPLCVRAYSFSHSPTMTIPVSVIQSELDSSPDLGKVYLLIMSSILHPASTMHGAPRAEMLGRRAQIHSMSSKPQPALPGPAMAHPMAHFGTSSVSAVRLRPASVSTAATKTARRIKKRMLESMCNVGAYMYRRPVEWVFLPYFRLRQGFASEISAFWACGAQSSRLGKSVCKSGCKSGEQESDSEPTRQ